MTIRCPADDGHKQFQTRLTCETEVLVDNTGQVVLSDSGYHVVGVVGDHPVYCAECGDEAEVGE